MRALITRPAEDAERLAEELSRRGIDSVIEPLLRIEAIAGATVALDDVQAILVTSRNGARALALATQRRDVPVFAVGDSSAELARTTGFETVESAAGDTVALAALVGERLDPFDGALLHASGATVAGDLAGRLTEQGFTVRRESLYDAVPVDGLSPDVRELLGDAKIDVALFFSPRTAEIFVRLIEEADLASDCAGVTAVCLSPAVAAAVDPIDWSDVVVAERPSMTALVSAIEAVKMTTDQKPDDDTTEPLDADAPVAAETGPVVEPEPEEPIREEPPRRSGARGFLWGAAVVIFLVAAAAVTFPVWRDQVPLVNDTLRADAGIDAQLDARLAEIERSVAGLRGAPQPGPDPRVDRLEATTAESAGRLQALSDGVAAVQQRFDGVEQRLAALEEALGKLAPRLAAIEKAGDSGAANAAATAASAERLAALEARIDEIAGTVRAGEARLTQSADARQSALSAETKSAIAAIDQRVARIESSAGVAAPASRAASLVLAIGQLRGVTVTNRPFATELAAVKSLAVGAPEIEAIVTKLAPHAPKGVPTAEMLNASFGPAAARAVRAAIAAPEGSWIDKTVAGLASVVTVRRTGANVEGDATDAIIARAEARVAANDLAGAISTLDALQGPSADAISEWRAAAASRLAVDEAMEGLTGQAISLLAGRTASKAE